MHASRVLPLHQCFSVLFAHVVLLCNLLQIILGRPDDRPHAAEQTTPYASYGSAGHNKVIHTLAQAASHTA